METADLIKKATDTGATLLVVDGKLKGKDLCNIDPKIRKKLKKRSDKVIKLLNGLPAMYRCKAYPRGSSCPLDWCARNMGEWCRTARCLSLPIGGHTAPTR